MATWKSIGAWGAAIIALLAGLTYIITEDTYYCPDKPEVLRECLGGLSAANAQGISTRCYLDGGKSSYLTCNTNGWQKALLNIAPAEKPVISVVKQPIWVPIKADGAEANFTVLSKGDTLILLNGSKTERIYKNASAITGEQTKIGNKTLILNLNNVSAVVRDFGGWNITCVLYEAVNGTFNNTNQEPFVESPDKFGANDSNNNGTNTSYKYQCYADRQFWGNENNLWKIDYSDICGECSTQRNIVNGTYFEDTYFIRSDGFIDPSFTFTSSNTNVSNQNITTEPNNASHLQPDNSTAPWNSLVAYYPFDADEYIGNWQTGKVGNALLFNGVNSYVSPVNNQLSTGATTHCAWANSKSITDNQYITEILGESNKGFYLVIYQSKILFGNRGNPQMQGNVTLSSNTWYHLCGVYDGVDITATSSKKIYVNGLENSGTNLGNGGGPVSSGNFIGINPDTFISQMNGSIDELRVWNRALSAIEILNLYSNESTGISEDGMNRTGLVLEYSFNASRGLLSNDTSVSLLNGSLVNFASAYDFSGNNNDGTYQNGSYAAQNGVYDDYAVFDGVNDWITTPINPSTSSSFGNGHPFTGSFWIKGMSSGGQVWFGENGGVNRWYWAYNPNGTVYIGLGSAATFLTGTRVNITNWTHIIVTYDGTNFNGYTNGQHTTTDLANAGSNTYGDNNIMVGGYIDGGIRYSFNGSLDEVMLFNSSLNASQALDIYANQSARFYPQGVQAYPFFKINRNETANLVNVTIGSLEQNYGSQWGARLGYWNTSYGYLFNDSVVHYYPGDGNANDVVGTLNGTLAAGATASNEGKINNSFTFDGINDYAIMNRTKFSSNHAISLWFKRANILGDQTLLGGCIDPDDPNVCNGGDANYSRIIFDPSGTINYAVSNNYSVRRLSTTTTAGFNDTTGWHNIIVSADTANSIVNIYIDGTLQGVTTNYLGSGAFSIEQEFSLGSAFERGATGATQQYFFNGSIDEVIILNKTLSADEVKQLYVSGAINHQIGVNWTFSPTKQFSGNRVDNISIALSSDYLLTELVANATNNTKFYSPVWFGNVTNAHYNGAVTDSTAPVVTLVYPLNNTFTNISLSVYNASISDNTDLKNATWYFINSTSGLTLNTTEISIAGLPLTADVQLNHSEGDGTYKWIYQACDNSNNCKNATNNFTITIDTVQPSIGLVSNTTLNGTYQQSHIQFNVSVNETNPQTLNGTLFNSTGAGLVQFRVNSTTTQINWTANFTSLADGNWSYYFEVNDTAGNKKRSETVKVTLDSIYPVCVWNTPSAGNRTSLTFEVNVTVTEGSLDTILIMNGTSGRNQTYTTPFNMTLPQDGNYTLGCWVNDSFGHVNETNRTINIDTTAWGNASYPASAQSVSSGTIVVNATSNETLRNASVWDSQNGVNTSICVNAACNQVLSTTKTFAAGTVRIVWSFADQLGNVNSSDFNITVSTASAAYCDIRPLATRQNETHVLIRVTTIATTGAVEAHTLRAECFKADGNALQNISFSTIRTGYYSATIASNGSGSCFIEDTAQTCGANNIIWTDAQWIWKFLDRFVHGTES